MGRVARYKKVKSFDPFSKKNQGRIDYNQIGVWGLGDDGKRPKKRSRTAERLKAQKLKRRKTSKESKDMGSEDDGFDAPPGGEDDFDMNDLVGSIKKDKLSDQLGQSLYNSHDVDGPAAPVSNPVDREKEEKKLNRLLKLDVQVEKKTYATLAEGRMEGESKRAYQRRVRAETRQIIVKEKNSMKNPERLQKKKDFLNSKRDKKRKKRLAEHGAGEVTSGVQDDNDTEFVTVDRLLAQKASGAAGLFNDQVDRPPVFKQLPRGAIEKARSKQPKEGCKLMSPQQEEDERRAMELLRKKTQAQYALIKKQRRGDFHL